MHQPSKLAFLWEFNSLRRDHLSIYFFIMNVEQIAQVCHEANRAYCMALGDVSHQEWRYAPDWQRKSAIAGVKAVIEGGIYSDEKLHENWMKDKIAEGWVYGEIKDASKKTHPCIRPYNEIPLQERVKDALFLAIVKTLKD